VVKQVPAFFHDNRVDKDAVFIDQVGIGKRLYECGAAKCYNVAALLFFERFNLLLNVAANKLRRCCKVAPLYVGDFAVPATTTFGILLISSPKRKATSLTSGQSLTNGHFVERSS
jgi:hypothetical protein